MEGGIEILRAAPHQHAVPGRVVHVRLPGSEFGCRAVPEYRGPRGITCKVERPDIEYARIAGTADDEQAVPDLVVEHGGSAPGRRRSSDRAQPSPNRRTRQAQRPDVGAQGAVAAAKHEQSTTGRIVGRAVADPGRVGEQPPGPRWRVRCFGREGPGLRSVTRVSERGAVRLARQAIQLRDPLSRPRGPLSGSRGGSQ